jgi:hypothetical protein
MRIKKLGSPMCEREQASQKERRYPKWLPRRRDFGIGGIRVGGRHFKSLEPHSLQVEFDGFAHVALHLFARTAGGGASGQVGRIGRVPCVGFLNDDQVFLQFLSSACLTMLVFPERPRRCDSQERLRVSSSLGACTGDDCHVSLQGRYHPSCSSMRTTSRTFTRGEDKTYLPSSQGGARNIAASTSCQAARQGA